MNFERYFTDREIIRQLCKERVKLAGQRHDRMFLHNISRDCPSPSPAKPPNWGDKTPMEIFPPRRLWHRFRAREGARNGSAADINIAALVKAVMTLRRTTPNAVWVRNLATVILRIRQRALDSRSFRFGKPTIIAEEKEPGTNIYRPLAVFALEDKIVDRQTGCYFRRAFDRLLCASCLAFRCSRRGAQAPTIHDALERILTFRSTSKLSQIFVAECDIRGFFDCVPHSLALSTLQDLVRKHDQTGAAPIDPRAIRIFDAYLKSYSFQNNIKLDAELKLRSKKPKARFKWPEAELADLHGKRTLREIGVPQGGALSCLIANAMLHSVDLELEQLAQRNPSKLLYLRYCDDMILLAAQKRICDGALALYCERVEQLGLLIHPPKAVGAYGKDFYSGKSHLSYPWGPGKSSIPWIQFVGYQVRHDHLVRVRLRSLKKQRRRMTKISDEVLKALNPGRKRRGQVPAMSTGIRRSSRQVEHRAQQRLISLSVGRRQLGQSLSQIMPMCWCNGFRGLQNRKLVGSSLKMLDRHRHRQIARIRRRLDSLKLPKTEAVNKEHMLDFYGLPFSYWGQFH